MTGASGRTITVRRPRQGGRRRASQPSRASDVVSLARLELAPHHVDILGLALLASGVFLAGVGYLGWPGGALGHAAVNAAYFALGVVGFVVPATLALGGLMVLLRELHPPNRPIRGGVACLVAALTLAMAAGTLGLGPGETSARLYWQPSAFRSRGGLIGEAELSVSSHLISINGASILALFLFVAGLMLITHASVAGFARTGGTRVAKVRRGTHSATMALLAALRLSSRPIVDRRLAAVWAEPGPPTTGISGVAPDESQVAVTALQADRAAKIERSALDVPAARPSADAEHDASEGGELGDEDAFAETEPDRLRPADLAGSGDREAGIGDGPAVQWQLPPRRILTRSLAEAARPDTAGQKETARALLATLGHFGVEATLLGEVTGPHITRYELRLAPDTKVAKIAQLGDDLAYALAATDIRILAPIPGKRAVGVEVPNARRRTVHLGDVFQDPPPDWSPLSVWLGKDIAGRAIGADLTKMPHLLVAGTTGAGKSACLNAMLCSILLRATPEDVRFVLVDPKQVELNHYEALPHLLIPVITSPRTAAIALQNLIGEMEQRYDVMSVARTRSLPELNRLRQGGGERPLPFILCVIDELADLMMVSPAEVEDAIIRLAQKARAVGIHLLLATQSPRADVITGMIKANVPSRIAFAVSSHTDSRVILDQGGAEPLLGQGDMLFSPLGGKVQRLQGAFIDERQIAGVTDVWRRQGEPDLRKEFLEDVDSEESAGTEKLESAANEDPLLPEAIALVAQMGTASTSLLQRRLRLGYTRAGRLIDMLERRGVIAGYEGSKPRQVLIGDAGVPRILSQLADGHGVTSEARVRRRDPTSAPAGSRDHP